MRVRDTIYQLGLGIFSTTPLSDVCHFHLQLSVERQPSLFNTIQAGTFSFESSALRQRHSIRHAQARATINLQHPAQSQSLERRNSRRASDYRKGERECD